MEKQLGPSFDADNFRAIVPSHPDRDEVQKNASLGAELQPRRDRKIDQDLNRHFPEAKILQRSSSRPLEDYQRISTLHEERDYINREREKYETLGTLNITQFTLKHEQAQFGYLAGPTKTSEATGFSPLNEKLDLLRTKAELYLHGCINELNELRDKGATENQVLQRLSQQVFDGTIYNFQQNSLLVGLAGEDGKRTANCEGRAKMAAALLENIGYDPKSQIFYQGFADHVRTVVRSANGLEVIEDGISPYTDLDGVTLTSAENSVVATLGLNQTLPPGQTFSLGTSKYHGGPADFLARVMPKSLRELMRKRPVTGLELGGATTKYSRLPATTVVLGSLVAEAQSRIIGQEASAKISRALKASSPLLKALAFFGAVSTAVDIAEFQTKDPSADSVQASVSNYFEKRTDSVEKLVAAATDTVNEVLEKYLKPDNSQPAQPATTEPDNAQTSRHGAMSPDFTVEMADRLPADLEKHFHTTFDGVDYILRSERGSDGAAPGVTFDNESTRFESPTPVMVALALGVNTEDITPHLGERTFTEGFWKALIRAESGRAIMNLPDKVNPLDALRISVIRFHSPDAAHTLSEADVNHGLDQTQGNDVVASELAKLMSRHGGLGLVVELDGRVLEYIKPVLGDKEGTLDYTYYTEGTTSKQIIDKEWDKITGAETTEVTQVQKAKTLKEEDQELENSIATKKPIPENLTTPSPQAGIQGETDEIVIAPSPSEALSPRDQRLQKLQDRFEKDEKSLTDEEIRELADASAGH